MAGHLQNYIHQIDFFDSNADSDKPRLLMIHGYGCSGSVFAKMIKYLKEYFRVTTIDLLGMGASGRPPFELSTAQECIDFFVLSIRAWMETVGYH